MEGIGSHTKPNEGQTTTWLTPPSIIKTVGPFDIDPACPRWMPWRTAATMYARGTRGEANPEATTVVTPCGLSMPWTGHIWCNPPYDKRIGWWIGKMAQHNDGIALTFARTETAWFFESVWRLASSLLFIEGRLCFHRPDGTKAKKNAGGPTVLIGYGLRATEKLRAVANREIPGQFIYLRERK